MRHIQTLPGLGQDYISQFFPGDIVTIKAEPDKKAVIVRTWASEEDEGVSEFDPLERPLLLGEVGMRIGLKGVRAIMPESDLELMGRNVLPGDMVKKTLSSPQAAIVLSIQTEVQLEKALSCEKVDGWIPMEKLTSAARFREGDRVVSEGWVGMVTLVTQVGYVLNQKAGRVYYPCDTMGAFEVGSKVSDMLDILSSKGVTMNIEPWAERDVDRVAATAQYQVIVSWQAMNQKVPIDQQWLYPIPKSRFTGLELKELTRISKDLDKIYHVGLAFIFKDEGDYELYGIEVRSSHIPIGETTALRILQTRTTARLQWPNGHITEELTTSIVPHDRMDEHESWPGQHVIRTDDDGQKQPAVVQRYDPVQRLVDIRYTDTSITETVSVLELDHSSEYHDEYGAALGELVFLCDDNGQPTPYVPSIGLTPEYSTDAAQLLTETLAAGPSAALQNAEWAGVRLEPNDIDWFGEVVTLEMDGRVGVRLCNGETVTVELKNILLLNTEMDEAAMMDTMGMDHIGYQDDEEYYLDEEDHNVGPLLFGGSPPVMASAFNQFMNRMGIRPPVVKDNASDASWETTSDEDADMMEDAQDVTDREPVPEGFVEKSGSDTANKPEAMETDSVADDADRVDNSIEMAPSSPPAQHSQPPSPVRSKLPELETNGHAGPSRATRDPAWEAFGVLESAPFEHRFFGEAPASSSRARMKKVNAEHKALRTSLPDNILVRTYEDRLDLMRVLIIGPEGTPYAGAPFVFDVFLHEGYPNAPPLVHFHSQTNGKGRCNPNLYEEGKVCLSILGTWMGDASESWHAERSSLLQVFVSISGLVLVRNPYHCEPAYAKLEGTLEGRINSRLYSEKAYVLSRGFVKQALAWPQAGLEKEIRHYYLTSGHLKEVVDHARALMEKEVDPQDEDGAEERWDADVIGSLTAGAKLSLKRVFASLEKTWRDYQLSPSTENALA